MRWSQAGIDRDHLDFPRVRPNAMDIAATEWDDLKKIDLKDPKSPWYHLLLIP